MMSSRGPTSTIAAFLQEKYRDALDVLLLAEEAFSCCKASIKDTVDNEGLLMLDIVW